MDIHLSINGERSGPFNLAKLQEMINSDDTLAERAFVWHSGLEDWIEMNQLDGLQLSRPVPPPPSPGVPCSPPNQSEGGDATGGIIPYKNPSALIAYYLGIVGLLPFIGFIFAIAAFFLGIRGYSRYRKNSIIKGQIHAWIGILLGALSIFYHTIIIIAMISNS